MAMMHTSAIYKSLVFGGVDSADYGIYITGEGVYNAPERAVELVSIPGRNGDFALDMGHYENIEIIYPAGSFADTQTNFADNFAAFRNAVASLTGYQRLEDAYHPNEYRMALFINGFEVEPVRDGTAAQFELKFNAKPQRWLTSGETAITVNDGDTVTNPTGVPAKPTLQIKGTGNVNIGDADVFISSTRIGDIELGPAQGRAPYTLSLANYKIANGDSFSIDNNVINAFITFPQNITSASLISWNGSTGFGAPVLNYHDNVLQITYSMAGASADYVYGTMKSVGCSANITVNGTQGDYRCGIDYNGSNGIVFDAVKNFTDNTYADNTVYQYSGGVIHSTASRAGNPTYINCDICEAYEIVNGNIIPLNRYVDIGAEPPTLAVGNTTVTYDATITELKIIPNWWQL